MTDKFTEIVKNFSFDLVSSNHVIIMALVACRLMPCVLYAPFLGPKAAPSQIKIVLVIMMALVVYPFVYSSITEAVPTDLGGLLSALLKEIFVGFSIGIVAQHLFLAIEMMGRFIDTARGSNMAEVAVPQMEGRATPIGDLYYQYAICLFFALGGHRVYITSIAYSFEKFPLFKPIPWADNGMWPFVDQLMHITSDILLTAIGLALPAVAATFLVDVVFGLMNRIAPQLNAYFMAMPVKAMSALILLLVSTSMIVERMEGLMIIMLAQVDQAVQTFTR